MANESSKNLLWVEKYRPKTIEDCILPEKTKIFFNEMKKSGDIQNMLLCGTHGVGKTTIARAFCDEVGAPTMFLNCSKDNSIDDVRTKIHSFSSSMSMHGNGLKVLIGDEFDYFSPNGQAALRGVIEQVSNNCRFIFTCNFPNKIIDPLRSRLLKVDFRISPADMPELAKQFMKRCCGILDQEGVEYEKQALAMIIKKYFPDFRKVVQMLQHAALVGKIDVSILAQAEGEYGVYINALKKKDYKVCRQWIGENSVDASEFFRTMFLKVNDIFASDSLAQAILALNQAQYRHAFVVDEELALSALTIELMSQCNFTK
jgi:DNA polymerase III delta prime subunit